jgi:hypothetical protein
MRRSLVIGLALASCADPPHVSPVFESEALLADHDDWEPTVAADPNGPFVYVAITRFGRTVPEKPHVPGLEQTTGDPRFERTPRVSPSRPSRPLSTMTWRAECCDRRFQFRDACHEEPSVIVVLPDRSSRILATTLRDGMHRAGTSALGLESARHAARAIWVRIPARTNKPRRSSSSTSLNR